jgi:acylphosphatase
MSTTLHLIIHGQVQGVFYRDSMRREAERLTISGWVRNCPDGTVEAMVQGEPEAVAAIVRWAQHGPEQARVERVVSTQGDGAYTGFAILY